MGSHLAKYQWKLNQTTRLDEQVNQLIEAGLEYSPAFLRLAVTRGLNTPEKILEAVEAHPTLFHDAYLMHDMTKAIERIMQSIDQGETILVYGDYDADGITSTLIMVEGLEAAGATVIPYLPVRFEDGYGPNLARYQSLVEEHEPDLLITVDNGIVPHEAFDYLKEQDIDVIVTDHHEIQAELPDVYAVIHPAHPAGNYPFKDLAGAGVALKVIAAIDPTVAHELLDLAAIGTVADMVPLLDENRTIVKQGLDLLKTTQRVGLQMLFEKNKIASDAVDEQSIGFVIGPRLNSLGRLGDPMPGYELLATYDDVLADELVEKIETINSKRQSLVQSTADEVIESIENLPSLPLIIVMGAPNWHAGVLGIVASRVVDRFQRPALLFQYDEDKQQYRGSGRSIDGVNLFELLSKQTDLLAAFGGHEQAAGMTVDEGQWENFQDAVRLSATELKHEIEATPELTIDLALSPSDVTLDFIDEIEQLKPFGMDYAEPVFQFDAVKLTEKRPVGKDRAHLKLTVSDEETDLQSIGFWMTEQGEPLNVGDQISVVGRLNINEWNQQRMPQLMLTDLGINETIWQDLRGSSIPASFWNYPNALYVFQDEQLAKTFDKQLPTSSQVMLYDNQPATLTQYSRLVVVEPPLTFHHLKNLIQADWGEIIFGCFIQEPKYLAGLPQREELALVYQTIARAGKFDPVEHLDALSKQVNLPLPKLKVILKMFYEAEFVIMKDGWMHFQKPTNQANVEMYALPAYQAYQEAMNIEKQLIYQNFEAVKSLLKGEN